MPLLNIIYLCESAKYIITFAMPFRQEKTYHNKKNYQIITHIVTEFKIILFFILKLIKFVILYFLKTKSIKLFFKTFFELNGEKDGKKES